ncbi:MAG: serine/threonine protein kinase [Planctomycetaceae bacterium]|nr:serine/threonine protein kinase [Planctomycetaceae bacterium]
MVNTHPDPDAAADEPPLDHEQQLASLLSALTDRACRGEPVDLAAECRAHPALAQELRELWGAVLVADAAGSDAFQSIVDPDPPGGAEAFHTPRRLGDFELLKEIGRGGMGVVYLARQVNLNRQLAVKMILRGPLASESDRERFLAEARAAARLDHVGIVPVYQIGEEGGRMYFSMKYIAGPTLSDLLQSGPLPPRRAALLLAKVSRAIDFAHQNGVLHRDLKPSNILLDEDGEPHVTDFGLAKQITDPHSLTQSGAVMGTPAYMSPEQAAGTRSVGPASDVYSLGAILYHMLTGEPPFQAASPVDAVLKVIEQDPVAPRQLNRDVDRDLELIAVRCLQKPPDLRYASAGALAADLEAYLNHEPISARSGRFSQVLSRWLRETHHAAVLENWGLLWMWHSLALLVACLTTNFLYWRQVDNRWYYFAVWTAGFGTWVVVFWALRHRQGPVTFVERQIAHIWAAALVSIVALFPLEAYLGLPPLRLSPVLGLITGMMFLVKAGLLSGLFYIQATALFLTAGLMAVWPHYEHLVFGIVLAASFFFPGLKYYRQQTVKSAAAAASPRASGSHVRPDR